MTGPRESQILRTPSVRDLLSTVLEDLLNGRCVVVAVPPAIDTFSIWQQLEHDLTLSHARPRYVSAISEDDVTPITTLSDTLEVVWPSARVPRTAATLYRLLQADPSTPDVIFISSIEQVTPVQVSQWVSLLHDWSDASSSMQLSEQEMISLCFIMPATTIPNGSIRTDAFLTFHDWFGVPSALEMQLIVRASSHRDQMTPRGMWREHLLPSLTGNDFQLSAHLWEAVLLDRAALEAALNSYAYQQRWDTRELRLPEPATHDQQRRWIDLRARPVSLPQEWRTLWQHGAAGWTPEYGLEVSSALLMLIGDNDQITHRLWRAQATLLLPQLDQLRLALCRSLEGWFGPSWATRWCEPLGNEEQSAVHENAMASQWGHITNIIRLARDRRDQCQRLAPLAEQARQVRNQIAHYRPITFPVYNSLQQEIARMRTHHLIDA